MKVAVYSLLDSENTQETFDDFLRVCEKFNFEIAFEISVFKKANLKKGKTFSSHKNLDPETQLFFSIGGDGTMLRAMRFIRDNGIPMIGINSGRLGFLATLQPQELEKSMTCFSKGEFYIEERILPTVEVDKNTDDELEMFPLALNEVVVSRKNTTSMLSIHTEVNGEYLNNYWADGLIVGTPTGSTGYSLSSGGPVMAPGSNTLILTPIAPHNLNARPMIISGNSTIVISVTGREKSHLLSLDSRLYSLENKTKIQIKKADFNINIAHLKSDSFFKTLRTKLLWGEDKRN